MRHEKKSAWRSDLAQVLRGILMGGADIIPGVSGGTVALILGIYRRLVTAISHFDTTFLRHVRQCDFKAASTHMDLRFLVTLFVGIALGVGGLAKLMHYLLEHHFAGTFSVFFGLILASCLLVARMVEQWNWASFLGLIAGTVFAYWLVGVLPAVPPAGNAYVLLCGMVGICAMILPGISGSFILLIMGKYSDITAALRDAIELRVSAGQLTMLVCFAAGCVIGLLVFSKFLRWLLSRFHSTTMAVLCGFLVGSLRKIWPFKHDVTARYMEMYDRPLKDIDATKRIYANYWPDELNEQVGIYLSLILAAALFVFALDWFSRGSDRAIAEELKPDAQDSGF